MQVDTDTHTPPFSVPLTANGSSTPAVPPAPSSSTAVEDQAPLVTLIHKASVQAVHRLYSKALTEQQNAGRYGALAMGVHGHTYEFEVKFRGPLCKATGQVYGNGLLEDIMHMAIHEVLSSKHLDNDLSFFLSRPSTLENVCLFVWRNINVIMAPHPYDVCEVSVESDPCPKVGGRGMSRSRVTFSGEMIGVPSLPA